MVNILKVAAETYRGPGICSSRTIVTIDREKNPTENQNLIQNFDFSANSGDCMVSDETIIICKKTL